MCKEARIASKLRTVGDELTSLFSLAVVLHNGQGGTGFTCSVQDKTRTDMHSLQAAIVCENDINFAVVGTFDRLTPVFTNTNPFHARWFAFHAVVGHLWVRKGYL